jgi:hypothetical protein
MKDVAHNSSLIEGCMCVRAAYCVQDGPRRDEVALLLTIFLNRLKVRRRPPETRDTMRKLRQYTMLLLFGVLAEVLSLSTTSSSDAARHTEECAAGSAVDCTVDSSWSVPPAFGWSPCSVTCGQGQTSRSRSVLGAACNGGTPCPVLTQMEECMDHVCPCHRVSCKVTCKLFVSHILTPFCCAVREPVGFMVQPV